MKTILILAVSVFGLVLAQHHHHQPRNFQQQQPAYQQQLQRNQAPFRQPEPQQQQQHQPQQQQQQQQRYDDSERAGAQNLDRRTSTTPIPILSWNKQQEHDGTYQASYETGNQISYAENGYIKKLGQGEDQTDALVQSGTYRYTSPEGQVIETTYTADETGFHVHGDHLPTPPPVSEEIQKGLDLIYAGIRQAEEEAAREAQFKSPQQQFQSNQRPDDNRYRP